LGLNSKAVHLAYAKHAEVTAPSTVDWEKDWKRNSHGKLLPMDFGSSLSAIA
jgi:hypothetical protein